MVRRFVARLLGFEGRERPLSPEFRVVLTVHTLFLTFTRLPGVFINTMLVGQDEGLGAVFLYNGAFYIFCALFMILTAKALCWLGPRRTAILGIAVYFVLYFTIFMLGEGAARFSVLIGLLNGLADGFYWIAYLQLFTGTTNLQNRDKGLALIQLFGAAVSLLVPLAGSLIIQTVGGLRGYLAVFAVAFGLALFTCLYTVKLPVPKDAAPTTNYRAALGFLRRKTLRAALAGQWAKGIREGTFLFILSVVLYQLVRSELLVGVGTFLSGGAAIGAFALMSRVARPQNRVRLMLWATVALTFTALAGFVWVTPQMVLAYSVLNAFFCGYVENTGFCVFLDCVAADPAVKERTPEMIALNEVVLVAGRITGMLVVAAVLRLAALLRLLGDSVRWELFGLLLLTLSQFAAVYFTGKAAKNL
jgi:Na+/melibiose symporter-like transporter